MKKIKTKWVALLLCCCCVCMVACDNVSRETEKGQLSEEVEPGTLETNDATVNLSFVDVYGNWYQMEVSDMVRKHPYAWENLVAQDGRMFYEDDAFSSRIGIDVSKYQEDIDWTAVADAGAEFAIIRLGYRGYGDAGKVCLDERFYDNMQGAKSAGLDVGVYFFSQAINEEEALEEAEFVLTALEGTELSLPVVYDPERILTDDARTDSVTGEQFTKNTVVFCERIREAGYDPMVYSNMLWEAFEFDMAVIEQYPVWYADYESVPQTPYDFAFWQYSEKGKIAGVEGFVDLNLQFVPK